MLIRDRVQFRFPKDRELLFAAAPVFQNFVNTYNERMAANDAGHGNKFMLHYGVECDVADWDLLLHVGLQLNQPREILNGWDMLIDFSEERLAMYVNSGKHVVQAYCVMAGVGDIPAIARMRQVRPILGTSLERWGVVGRTDEQLDMHSWPGLFPLSSEELIDLNDAKVTGIIGIASWETYLAASYGLPVIEIVPEGRPVAWLSKWINPFYRAVSGRAIPEADQIRAAMENIKEALKHGSQIEAEV